MRATIQLCEATSTPCSCGHNSSLHRLQHHHLQDRHDGAHDCHALARPAARGPGGVDAHHSPIYLVGSQKDEVLHSALAHFSARRVRIRAHSSLSLSKFSLDELALLAEVRRPRVCSSRLILLSRCWQSTPQEDHERGATAGRARLARARAVYAAHPLPCALIPAVPRVVLCSRVCSSGRTETGSARPRSLVYVMVLRTVSCSNGAQWSERLA